MTMFSMKPKFDLAEFLAESAPKKNPTPKTLPRKKSSKASPSQGAQRESRKQTDMQE